LAHAIAVAAVEGTIVLAGVKSGRLADGLPIDPIPLRRLTIRGVRGVNPESWGPAIRFIEQTTAPIEKLNTHMFVLANAERAVRTLAGEYPEERAIHVAIVPHGG
jgi:threonine dehydrogenase-like Zn-dependent dehydrogenase